MRKMLFCASVVGVVAGVVYWIYKKEKFRTDTTDTVDNKVDLGVFSEEEKRSQNENAVEEMYEEKSKSVQDVCERHFEAGSIMKDAYCNIMEDFVEDFSDKKDVNGMGDNKEVSTNDESVSVMKEIDSISDELNDLLM